MIAIIVKLDTEAGVNNFQKEIGDPMEEIIGDQDNNILLFFKCSDKKHKKEPLKGVTIIDRYCYNNESIIHKRIDPIDVPSYMERYVFDFASEESHLISSFEGLKTCSFLEDNYCKGGMILLKDMKRLERGLQSKLGH